MLHQIDLHGLPHEQAILETEDFLLRLSVNLGFEATIITGNSHRLQTKICLLYTSPSPRDRQKSRMPSSA